MQGQQVHYQEYTTHTWQLATNASRLVEMIDVGGCDVRCNEKVEGGVIRGDTGDKRGERERCDVMADERGWQAGREL